MRADNDIFVGMRAAAGKHGDDVLQRLFRALDLHVAGGGCLVERKRLRLA